MGSMSERRKKKFIIKRLVSELLISVGISMIILAISEIRLSRYELLGQYIIKGLILLLVIVTNILIVYNNIEKSTRQFESEESIRFVDKFLSKDALIRVKPRKEKAYNDLIKYPIKKVRFYAKICKDDSGVEIIMEYELENTIRIKQFLEEIEKSEFKRLYKIII